MPGDRKLPNFDRQPLLWLAIAFTGGILASKLLDLDPLIPILASIVFGIAAMFFRGRAAAAYLMIAAFAGAGFASATIESRSVADNRVRVLYDNGTIVSGDPVEVEGVLLGRPEQTFEGVFLTLRAERLRYRGTDRDVSGRVRLFLPDTAIAEPPASGVSDLRSQISNLKYGSRIRAACKLDRDDEFLDPGVVPKKEMLDRSGMDATGSVKSPRLIEHLADESVFIPLAWVYDRRADLIDGFRANLSPRAAGVMIACLLGDKYFLDKESADLFRDGGTFHILVISGLHITFIGGLILLFVRLFTRNRWLQFIVTISILWAYTFAVGANVPVMRASIMFTVFIFSYVINRQASLLNSLGICGLILLVWRPSDVANPSLQLTFVSIAAIIMIGYPLIDRLRRIGGWEPTVREPFPPMVPKWLKEICETLFWDVEAWEIRSKRQIWTAKLLKSPFFSDRFRRVFQKTLRYAFEAVIVSSIVQICMLPLAVIYFHRVSVSSILLNLWVSVFVALESFAAVIGVLADRISILLATPFLAFAEISNSMMLAAPRLFSDSGWASFRLPAYSGPGRGVYFIYFLPLLYLAYLVNRWDPFSLKPAASIMHRRSVYAAATALTALIFIIITHPFSAPRPDGRLHIDFLDVGQGDAALVTFPNGRTLLVDGGGHQMHKRSADEDEVDFVPDTRRIGEAVVSEFLWYRGYSRIDQILATHADADHIQGLADVAKNFQIGRSLFGRTPMKNPDFAAVSDILYRRGVPMEIVSRGDRFDVGDASVEVLSPTPTSDPDAVSDNDHSVVLRITYGGRSFLLTGDIEKTAERDLLTDGAPLEADVVKVPHHGSRTSSTQEFIYAISARDAVISVGRLSPFGHPHPDVVARWKAAGVNVLTTGERGTITISTDGKDLEIRTFQP